MSLPRFTPPSEDFEPPPESEPLPEPADVDLPEYTGDQAAAEDRDHSSPDEPAEPPD